MQPSLIEDAEVARDHGPWVWKLVLASAELPSGVPSRRLLRWGSTAPPWGRGLQGRGAGLASVFSPGDSLLPSLKGPHKQPPMPMCQPCPRAPRVVRETNPEAAAQQRHRQEGGGHTEARSTGRL